MKKNLLPSEELLRMYREGKLQKEIAAYFGVSPAAVCKRLKRLLPLPESLQNLTEKEKRFVIEKAKGKTNVQAVTASYECNSLESAKAIGTKLMAKPEIETAINDVMDMHGLTTSYRIQRLKQHVDHSDPIVSLKGLDMSFKLDGSYAPERHAFAGISIVEIVQSIDDRIRGRGDTGDDGINQ